MNRTDDDGRQTGNSSLSATGRAPFVAKLVESSEAIVRVGSPFREDPPDLLAPSQAKVVPVLSGEAAYGEFGPFLYTAMGASAAAVVVLVFAAIGAWWFPAGGALVAVLGTILSIIGLFSTRRYRYAACGTLPLHMVLFFLSYARTLG